MFTPKQKRIYKWHDGTRERRSDPLAVELAMTRKLGAAWRSLHDPMRRYSEYAKMRVQLGPTIHDAMALASLEAQDKYVQGVRAAFGLGDPCDPADDDKPSLDADQCMDLMGDFFRFMKELEDAARPLPSSPLSSDLAAKNSPIENSSDSIVSGTTV